MESSYHVFVLKEVNTCFTSYAAVNLCQKRSRNLDKINPSQVSGSSETCQITYNTATSATSRPFLSISFSIKVLYNSCTVFRFLFFSPASNTKENISEEIS